MSGVIPVGYSNYLKTVSSHVQKNIFALKNIQTRMDKLEFATMEERFKKAQDCIALEQPITNKIISFINGSSQAEKSTNCSSIKVSPNQSKHFKGIPAFWPRVFIIEGLSADSDMKCDNEILRTLKDIRLNNSIKTDGQKGVVFYKRSLEFEFDENEHMKPQSVCVELSYSTQISSNSRDNAKVEIIKPFVWKGKNPYETMDVNDFTFFLPFFFKDDIRECMIWFNRIYDLKSFMASTLQIFKEDLSPPGSNERVSMEEEDEDEDDKDELKRYKGGDDDYQPKRKATKEECHNQ